MSVAGMLKDYGKTVKGSATKVNVRKVAEHICCVVLGFLFSMSGFGERFSPFGISFVGGVWGYEINIASPKEKNLYFSLTASL